MAAARRPVDDRRGRCRGDRPPARGPDPHSIRASGRRSRRLLPGTGRGHRDRLGGGDLRGRRTHRFDRDRLGDDCRQRSLFAVGRACAGPRGEPGSHRQPQRDGRLRSRLRPAPGAALHRRHPGLHPIRRLRRLRALHDLRRRRGPGFEGIRVGALRPQRAGRCDQRRVAAPGRPPRGTDRPRLRERDRAHRLRERRLALRAVVHARHRLVPGRRHLPAPRRLLADAEPAGRQPAQRGAPGRQVQRQARMDSCRRQRVRRQLRHAARREGQPAVCGDRSRRADPLLEVALLRQGQRLPGVAVSARRARLPQGARLLRPLRQRPLQLRRRDLHHAEAVFVVPEPLRGPRGGRVGRVGSHDRPARAQGRGVFQERRPPGPQQRRAPQGVRGGGRSRWAWRTPWR